MEKNKHKDIKKTKIDDEKLKKRRHQLLQNAKEDHRFLRKQIKLFFAIMIKAKKRFPKEWEIYYNCTSANTLVIAREGLIIYGENYPFKIAKWCNDEMYKMTNLISRMFDDYCHPMPVVNTENEIISYTAEMEKNIKQKNGRMKKLRIHVNFYQ